MNNFEQAQAYLFSLIRPQVTHDAPQRVARLLERLGNPQQSYDIVHVAGTSGKGSTCTLIAALLTAGGWKTGLTVSPHLEKITERIQIDGRPVSEERFIQLVGRVRPHIEALEAEQVILTFFDVLLVLALLYWAEEGVRIAVVETGIGGTHDGSNALQPRVAVLTNVGLDHTELLGNTVEQIAADKAGIIKPGVVAVSGVTQPAVRAIVEERCRAVRAPLLLIGQDWNVHSEPAEQDGERFNWCTDRLCLNNVKLRMIGRHQTINAGTALTVLSALAGSGYDVDEVTIRKTLAAVQMPGRMEMLASNLMIDGAHNPDKMRALVNALGEAFPARPITAIIAAKKGKDVAEMVGILAPHCAQLIVTRWGSGDPVADRLVTSPERLAEIARTVAPNLPLTLAPSPAEALDLARTTNPPDGLIVITGSLYLVGEMRAALGRAV